jgi:branched-chain amino acid transport system permease protein
VLYLYGALAGIVGGAVYSLIAVSITLMYRSTGVLSFAHAAFATVAAYVYADLAGEDDWPPLAACVAALGVSVAYALIVERLAIRPASRRASATGKLIATLGVVSFTVGVILLVYGFEPGTAAPYLLPSGTIRLGRFNVDYQQLGILALAGVGSLVLGAFLQRTQFGTAIRATAENPEAARLMGASPSRVSQFNWALGGLLAGLAGVMIAPLVQLSAATFLLVLVKALSASLFGGLVSLPLTFAGGLVVGALESVITLVTTMNGARDVVVLALVIGLLYFRRSWPAPPAEDPGTAFSTPGPLAARLRTVAEPVGQRLRPLARRARVPGAIAAALAGVALVTFPIGSEFWGFVGVRSLFIVLEALSLVLLVGWGGQVSLMHGAYVGIGAFMTGYFVVTRGLPLELAIPAAGLAAMAMGALAGLPALRLPGLQFAVASIVFSTVAAQWLFVQGDFFPRSLPRGTLFGVDLFESANLYLLMLPVTALFYLAAWNVRRSTFGELLVVSRDTPFTVAHFGADPRRTRMATFMLASFMAGVGGAFYGILLTTLSPADYSLQLSIGLLLYAIVGGAESLWGPLIAGLLFGVLPEVMQRESTGEASAWPDIISGLTVIALIAFRPAGLASLLPRPRRAGGAGEDHRPARLMLSRFEVVAETAMADNGGHAPVPADGGAKVQR